VKEDDKSRTGFFMGEPSAVAFQSVHHRKSWSFCSCLYPGYYAPRFLSAQRVFVALSSKPMNETYLLPSSFINMAFWKARIFKTPSLFFDLATSGVKGGYNVV